MEGTKALKTPAGLGRWEWHLSTALEVPDQIAELSVLFEQLAGVWIDLEDFLLHKRFKGLVLLLNLGIEESFAEKRGKPLLDLGKLSHKALKLLL